MRSRPYHHGDLKNALIEAGIRILSRDGIGALSLRRVAREAGVSHAAPYAHFADKQELVAAISTEGYRMIHDRIREAADRHPGDPLRRLLAASTAYLDFALERPEHFRITLSGVVERQRDCPAYVEVSHRGFGQVVEIVEACQSAGILPAGPGEEIAVTVWSMVHGLVSLLIEEQIPHALLADRPHELLAATLGRIVRVPMAGASAGGRRAVRARTQPPSRRGRS